MEKASTMRTPELRRSLRVALDGGPDNRSCRPAKTRPWQAGDPIPALSARRPWSNLLIAGYKRTENRGWTTNHRGPVVIHSGKKFEPSGAAAAAAHNLDPQFARRNDCAEGYLGIAWLEDVHLSSPSCCTCTWAIREPGTFHWVFTRPAAFTHPMPGPGRLSLYTPPTEVVDRATRLIDQSH